MNDSNQPPIPAFATLAADPEIAPLLHFEPVARKVKRKDGWTPELQRELIARIAATGSLQDACGQMEKHASGAETLYKVGSAETFRASWDSALALGRRRNGLDPGTPYAGEVPGITRRPARGQSASGSHPPPDGELPVLPVICDKCGTQGVAGDEAFADIPYLLAFDPVPRPPHDRLWDAPTQRAFIAALAMTGSVERAARSIKRHGFAVEKLRKSRGAREFNEACEAALDVARQREVAKMGGRLSELRSGDDDASGDEGYSPDHVAELRERLVRKLQKLRKRLVLEEIMPDPEKRAAWILINGPEEIDAIEAELRESAERKATDSAADTSTSARDEHRSHAGAHGEKRYGPDRTAGRLASSEPNPSDGEGEFTSPKQPSASSSSPQRRGPRIYNLNDPRAFEMLCPRDSRPWIPNGALPREKRPDRGPPVQISGGSEEEAQQAFKEWQAHVDAGRIGKKTSPTDDPQQK